MEQMQKQFKFRVSSLQSIERWFAGHKQAVLAHFFIETWGAQKMKSTENELAEVAAIEALGATYIYQKAINSHAEECL